MKTIGIYFLVLVALVGSGCSNWGFRTVNGNGIKTVEERSVSGFDKISVGGQFDITIEPASEYGLTIEADENLVKYIFVDTRQHELRIRIRKGVNVRSKIGLRIRIGLPSVKEISLAGGGKVKVLGIIKNNEKLKLSVAGSGTIEAGVHVPEVNSEIAGSGTINLGGETQEARIKIAGSGDYKAIDLKAETTDVEIAGSGSAWVFASTRLKVSIAGSGDVRFKGNPANVDKSIAGSGSVKPVQ